MPLKPFCYIIILLFFFATTRGQSTTFEQKIAAQDSIHFTYAREKIFIHLDKPFYRPKDTLWLKGYMVTAADHTPNDSSRIVHIEIINSNNEVLKRSIAVSAWGLFSSYIVLAGTEYTQGEFLLRAYTQYMRNYGDSLFFSSGFTIIDPLSPSWRINFEKLLFQNGQLQLRASANLTTGPPAKNREMQVRLLSKNKSILKTILIPDSWSKISLDTSITAAPNDPLEIEITNKDGLQLKLPVPSASNVPDLQFLPEGGCFLQNQWQQVGFKALNSLGKAIDVKGVIKDNNGVVVTPFATKHKGMGTLYMKPETGKKYTAVLADGTTFTLPNAINSGYLLQVNSSASTDSLRLTINCSPDKRDTWVYFTATARGTVRAWGRQKIKETPINIALDKKQFPAGVIVFTLYNEAQLPVNERAIFVSRKDVLQIKTATHQPFYQNRDSVAITLMVSDENNDPVAGSFSLSVIDTSQVVVNTLQENLQSYMLLSSDLRGTIEDPSFYFNDTASEAADALMLTQGWVSYQDTTTHNPFAYEKEFSIHGRVTNIFNKPTAKSNITLFGRVGKDNLFLLDTLSNQNGEFCFNNFPFFDTDSISIVIKALNKKGKSFNVGVELDTPDYPEFKDRRLLANAATITNDSVAKKITGHQQQLEENLKKEGIYLREVVVTARAKIQGSKNLNSDGGADQVINEATLEKTPKESLLDVLQQQIKGFRVGTLRKSIVQRYMINSNIARFVIDGVDLEFFYQSNNDENMSTSIDYLLHYKSILSYFNAEDIKAIEIMNTPRYNMSYKTRFLDPIEAMNSSPVTVDYSFVEITTQSGSGPFLKKTPGIYLLKPIYPLLTKQFYSPRYSNRDEKPPLPDLRTTVYWNPDIITDSTGRARVSFYSSESKSNYLMVIQGTDLKGRFAVWYQPIFINPQNNTNALPSPSGE